MSLDILESLNSALGGPLIRQISVTLGESEEGTRAAVRSVGPTVLAGLMQQAALPSSASRVFRTVSNDGVDAGIVGKLSSILGNRGSFNALSELGESLSASVFGNHTGAVSNAISQVSGVKPRSALTLLSMGLPLVFGMLRKHVTQNGLNVSGLASLLLGQRASLEKAGLDNRITSALGFGSLSSLLNAIPSGPSAARAAYQPTTATRRNDKAWLPLAIAAGIAALGLLLMFNRAGNDRGAEPAVAGGSTAGERAESMRLASASTKVYFGSGETSIDNEDRRKIAGVAHSVRDQDRPVAITGYTDRSGNSHQNLELAKNRAVAVREALVAEGVPESRIVMDPPAVITGAGTDAEARRVDIEVH